MKLYAILAVVEPFRTWFMPLGNFFKGAEPYVIGLGVPVGLLLLAIIMPVQFLQYGMISALTTKIDESEKKADLRFAFFDRNAEGRIRAISTKLDEINRNFELRQSDFRKLEERIAEVETDPKMMLERVGIVPSSVYTAVSYRGEYYILPKTQASFDELRSKGYQPKQISPIVAGFLVNPVSADVISNPNMFSPIITTPR